MKKSFNETIDCGREQKRERFLLGSLVFALTLTFSLLYLNRYVVDNFLWNEFNSILFHNGLMPYRDFFVYVPPALLVKNTFLWYLFGETILGMVIAGVFERALIFVLIYSMLSKHAKPLYAFVATMLSYLVMLSGSFDTVGDYSWMCIMLTVLVAFCIQEFFKYRASRPIVAFLFLSAAFFFAVLDIMTKQSNGLILTCAVLLLMIIYTVCSRFKHAIRDFAAILLGLAAGAAPWLIWLGTNDALSPFFKQVFGDALNSKGVSSEGRGSTLINSIFSIFNWKYFIIFALALAIFLLHDFYKGKNKEKYIKYSIGGIVLVILLEHILKIRSQNFTILQAIFAIIFVAIFAVAVFYLARFLSKKNNSLLTAVTLGIGFFVFWAAVSFANSFILWRIPTSGVISYVGTIFSHAALMICVALCVRYIIRAWIDRTEDSSIWIRFTLIVAGLALAVGTLLGGGDLNYMGSVCFITVPFVLTSLLSHCETLELNIALPKKLPKKLSGRSFRICCRRLILCICAIVICSMSTIVMAGKIRDPYSWWGVNAGQLSDEGSYTIDYDIFEGYLVSKEIKVRYEQIGKLIEENSSKDDFVLTFPYSVIYKIETERYNAPTKVPVYFFDVCSDDMARSDLEIIKENPPKIIVWMDIGEECWSVHEYLFRGGNRLGQRDIQDWFSKAIETDYVLIGNVGNQYVFRLLDRTPINYTYFADEEDMVSNIDEVRDNIRSSNYVYKLSSSLLGTQGYNWLAIYLPVAVALLLLVIFCIFAKTDLSKLIIFIFGALYLLLPCKPALLCAFIFPFVLIAARKRDKLSIVLSSLSLVTFALSLLGWWSIWNAFVQYIALALVIIMMAIVLASTVASFISSRKNK